MTPIVISAAPKTRIRFTCLTGTPKTPKWSIIKVTSICPAIARLNDRATPMRGTSITIAETKNAPNNPPIQAIGGAFFAEKILPNGTPVAKI